MRLSDTQKAALLSFATPTLLLTGAFGSQLFGLVACEMCWWQRWAHFAALPFAIIACALAFPPRRARSILARSFAIIASIGILASGVIGVLHTGVERKWWSGFTACTANIPNGLTSEQMLDYIMNMPIIRCDTPQWMFLGLSMASWNAMISLLASLTIVSLTIRANRRAHPRAALAIA